LCLGEKRPFAFHVVYIGFAIGAVLCGHLLDQLGALTGSGAKRRAVHFGLNTAQLQSAKQQIRLHGTAIGLRDDGGHAHENLAGCDFLTVGDKNLAHHAGLGRLHDLDVAAWDQLTLRHRNDVQPPEDCPGQHDSEQGERDVEHRAG
jgi:hypothetical protein